MKMKRFKNKVVLITGASSGIGKALAEEFAHQGAYLVLCARREERIFKIANEINSNGGSAVAVRCDVTQEEDLKRAVAEGLKKYAKIDLLIANAGFGVAGKFEDLKISDYRRQFETNVFGVLASIYACLDALKASRGQIVIIGSVNSYLSYTAKSAYAMSKFAVRALSDSLWHELKAYGIGVTLICPGYVESEIRNVDNYGQWRAQAAEAGSNFFRMPAETAARKILKAVYRRKREAVITLHGKLGVFLGRHFPQLLHFLLALFRIRGRNAPTEDVKM